MDSHRPQFISYGAGQPNAGVCCDAFLPTTSTSSTRLYYVEGPNTLRYIASDSTTGTIGTLPNVPGKSRAIFSVSPTDDRIAIALFDWSKRPMSVDIYVQDLYGGGNRVDIFSSTNLYEWPVGWHNGELVLAGEPSLGGSDNPYAASWYHLVDASTGSRLAVLAGSDCPAVGPLSTGGTACISASCHCIEKVDWSGKRLPTYVYKDPGESGWAMLSPDGGSMIFVEIDGPREGSGIWHAGQISWLGVDDLASRDRWLDDQHALVTPCPDSHRCLGIQDLKTGKITQLDGDGEVVGMLPGGL
jgi:hypothetical protein